MHKDEEMVKIKSGNVTIVGYSIIFKRFYFISAKLISFKMLFDNN
jgi:hypothetical protein